MVPFGKKFRYLNTTVEKTTHIFTSSHYLVSVAANEDEEEEKKYIEKTHLFGSIYQNENY